MLGKEFKTIYENISKSLNNKIAAFLMHFACLNMSHLSFFFRKKDLPFNEAQS